MGVDPRFKNGWEAAKAAGFCIQCMTREHEPGKSMCEHCADLRNIRSRRRNEQRPTTQMTRRRMQDLLEGVRGP